MEKLKIFIVLCRTEFQRSENPLIPLSLHGRF